MRLLAPIRIVALFAALGLCATAQVAQKETVADEVGGIPPRTSPSEYPGHAQVGMVTLAADFTGHTITTLQGNLRSEDYVAVEVAAFGPPQAHFTLATENFTLRINGKKPLDNVPYVDLLPNLKDPEWEPPTEKTEGNKKTRSTNDDSKRDLTAPPPVIVYPPEVRRGMAQRIRKVQLPLGEKPLPQDGLLFFPYGGSESKIKSVELIYNGPAGKATLALHP